MHGALVLVFAERLAMDLRSKAKWWSVVSDEGEGSSGGAGEIRCELCPKRCVIVAGDRGACYVRKNVGGEMVAESYGWGASFRVDPIEKKPLYHFLPGTPVLSFGGAGCNLSCDYCIHSVAGVAGEMLDRSAYVSAEDVVQMAISRGCRSIAFTDNDPIVFAEYVIDIARLAREKGIKTVVVSSGYISGQARAAFFHYIDAANIDLKGFDDAFYESVVGGRLQPVLNTLRYLKCETDIWFELTYLLLTGKNDDAEVLRRMCEWILLNLGDEVPLHFTAYHPRALVKGDLVPTHHEGLIDARDLALSIGLKYVYLGNVYDEPRETTYCPSCRKALVRRNWFKVGGYDLNKGCCDICGCSIAGVYEQGKGDWGRKSLPLKVIPNLGA